MIEVSVREDDRLDPIFASAERGDVRNQVVDARHILFRELKSKIDDV